MTNIHKIHFGLSKIDRDDLEKVFRDFPTLKKVVLYGSRAKGTYKRGSDIDLAVSGNVPLNSIRNALYESHIPYKVDVCDFDAIQKGPFRDEVEKYGAVIFEK